MQGTCAGVGIGLGPPQIPLDVATPSRVTDTALGIGLCHFRLPYIPPAHTIALLLGNVLLPLANEVLANFGL